MSREQPIAYIICGFIGAGKTTFARKLEKETGALRITKDEWMISLFGNQITSDKNFEKYDHNVIELTRNFAFKILKSGKDVIIDEGFWVQSQRDDIKKRIVDNGAKPILYYVECPIDTMRKRVVERTKSPSEDSFVINGDMFDHYLQFWQPPTKEEGVLLCV